MKYHEAINGPDGELWKQEVKKEHKRMINSGVFEPVNLSEVPDGVKLTDTTWAMKKKSTGTLQGRVNVHGFKQIDWQHYNGTSFSVGGHTHHIDVKQCFLQELKESKQLIVE
jgi:hypothetical protein